ncbi:MAG TPA: fibronectin type III domain-containing protein [Spirochaetota bacterium]|nr:fibronectin type III domain-containing protein [Spirochaetota bacterium]HPC42545.1 fibronectin type III domain-containing protein [Spirochaetota bacterium]HPL15499.1 fibronectin type III domain-containing protein [Spirochaetota bacterium]HQJ71928.1 fibronectin type III domain-containing protein [Spirochaetota bacterium]HRS78732.1 fibronectin type III domain-containing protein [Spirochaetota bacterium]
MKKTITIIHRILLLPLALSCGAGPIHEKRAALLLSLPDQTETGEPSAPPSLPPPVTALKGWELDGSNTGLTGAGIDRTTLPLYEPPAAEVQYGTWFVPAGTVMTGQRVEMGGIDLSAGNITFERCWFRPTSIGRGMPLVRGGGAVQNTIRSCDIDGSAIPLNADGTNPACGSIAVSCSNIRVLLCNITALASGVAFFGEEPVTLEGTYIHDLVQGEWFPGSGQSHQDGFTIRDYAGPLALIRNSHILTNPASHIATGAFFLQGTWDDCFMDNIYVTGNLLAGYGYNLAVDRDNGGYGRHLWAVDNRFDPYSGWLASVGLGPGWALWRDNCLNDTGQADNRGTAVAEPMTQANPFLRAPGDLRAAAESATAIRLTWKDLTRQEIGYRVMRSPDGAAFTTITITGPNAASYTDTGLTAGAPITTALPRSTAAGCRSFPALPSLRRQGREQVPRF